MRDRINKPIREQRQAVTIVQRTRGRAPQTIWVNHLSAEPLCVVCKAAGRVSIATELDHVVALTNCGADFDKYQQVQPNGQELCNECHSKKQRLT